MLQRVMEWERRRPMWLRCTAWALLLFHLYFAGFPVLRPYDVPFPFLWPLPLSMVGALVVGVHLRSWAWVRTPLVVGAVVAAFGALLLLMGLAASTSFTPGAEEYVVASGVLMIAAGVVLGITHALTAAGVWWGQRREAAKVGSSESSLSGDASPEAML